MSEIQDLPIVGEATDAPTIFIDGMQGISVTNGVAKINLFQVIQDLKKKDGAPHRMIVARLAMSVRTLAQVVIWLSENAKVEIKEGE